MKIEGPQIFNASGNTRHRQTCRSTNRRGNGRLWQKEADAEPVRQITGLYSMRYAMRSRADATSAEACRTFQNLAIHPSCRRTPVRSEEAAVLLAAQHGLPIRTIHPGSHGLLRHRIQDPCGPNVRLANCVGLLHDLDSLSLHQAVDAHFTASARSDLLVGGELKGVVGRDIGRPAGMPF